MSGANLDNQDGFTLIEVLVAFAILAGAIVMTFQIFGDGLRGLNAAQARAKDVQIAQNQLDLLSASSVLKEGTNLVTIDGVKLRITTEAMQGFKQDGTILLRPFHVKAFRDDGIVGSEPILETIIIAKSSPQ
jgi:prepilin-type N-terminal cleavage/methylation domain-containing protein